MIRPFVLTGLLVLGSGLAACADYPPPPPPPYAVHVDRCFHRHANYDPRTNTFIGWDGYPHVCRA